jgi:hypothetical protein
MTQWSLRSQEERALLNPSFSTILIWQSAAGYFAEAGQEFALGTVFLVLPMVLHRETRESLPRSVATSLPVWLEDNKAIRARLPDRARLLVPHTKEALMFGGLRGFLAINHDSVSAELSWRAKINTTLADSSDEVRECAKKANFLGRWLARAGSPTTVLMLMGVRP